MLVYLQPLLRHLVAVWWVIPVLYKAVLSHQHLAEQQRASIGGNSFAKS
jgi:hypothetical protein